MRSYKTIFKSIKNYEKNTDNFELVEMGQDLIYSRVLVETLFGVSFLFSSDSYPLYGEECAYAIFTLEVIFNYKIDSIPRKPENEMLEILKNDAHILAELKRIDYDITIANSLDTDKNIIITLQKEYRTLSILN